MDVWGEGGEREGEFECYAGGDAGSTNDVNEIEKRKKG